MKVAIVGAGAWGTALAISWSARHQVVLHVRDRQHAAELDKTRENTRYLPGVALPASLAIDTDFQRVARDAELHVVATPLAGLRGVVRQLRECAAGVPLVWACKGLESGSGKLGHEIVAEELGADAPAAALTGPSFADEVARGLPTAVTLAARDLALAERLANALHQPRFRVYANDDIVGAEIGGAVKNVIAIAAGIADGLGFGLNARAALMTRALAEVARLGLALGARRDTFLGLAGMGDLLLTGTGNLSRNRRVGLALAAGRSLKDILAELGHVAEGVLTTREVARIASARGVDMPITQAVDGVLFHGLSPQDAVEVLLMREPRPE